MSISIGDIQVSSFETTPELATPVGPVTPYPVCDSPLCVPTWNRPACPETGTVVDAG